MQDYIPISPSVELTAAKERVVELKHQNKFLEITLKREMSDLRHKLKASEEEVMAKSIAYKVERQKVHLMCVSLYFYVRIRTSCAVELYSWMCIQCMVLRCIPECIQ